MRSSTSAATPEGPIPSALEPTDHLAVGNRQRSAPAKFDGVHDGFNRTGRVGGTAAFVLQEQRRRQYRAVPCDYRNAHHPEEIESRKEANRKSPGRGKTETAESQDWTQAVKREEVGFEAPQWHDS